MRVYPMYTANDERGTRLAVYLDREQMFKLAQTLMLMTGSMR